MKKAVLLLLAFSVLIVISCKRGGCGDEDFSNIKDFYINTLVIKTTDLNFGNPDTTLYLPFYNILKAISVGTKTDLAFKDKSIFSFFFNSAYACSPPESKSVQGISKIIVISKTEFQLENNDDTIQIGDTITNKFSATLSSNFSSNSFKLIKDFVKTQPTLYLGESVLLRLYYKPYKETYFKFDIIVQLSDNTIQTFNVQTLRVK